MKNLSKGKFTIVLSLLVVCLTATTITIKNKTKEQNHKTSIEYAEKLTLQPKGEYDREKFQKVKDGLSLVPHTYLERLYSKGVHMRAVIGPITSLAELNTINKLNEEKGIFQDAAGIFMCSFMAVRIDEGYFPGIELHEVGHAVDYRIFNQISSTQEYINIFKKEGEQLFNKPGNEYFLQNPQEYFAETFNFYYFGYTTKEILKDRAPETYKFIKSLEVKNN